MQAIEIAIYRRQNVGLKNKRGEKTIQPQRKNFYSRKTNNTEILKKHTKIIS